MASSAKIPTATTSTFQPASIHPHHHRIPTQASQSPISTSIRIGTLLLHLNPTRCIRYDKVALPIQSNTADTTATDKSTNSSLYSKQQSGQEQPNQATMSVNEVKIKRAEIAFELRGTGPPTSRTFVLGDEDHTLGNALRHVLINDARVDFAGYCVPHPSEPVVHLRVQTNEKVPGGDGSASGGTEPLTAIEALKEACSTLSKQCDFFLEQLENEMPEVKVDRERMERLEEELMNGAEEEEEDMDVE